MSGNSGDAATAAPPSRAQASNVSFDLHSLGWKAFQDLCLAIAEEVLKRPVETFLSSHDGGRDGAFIGSWNADSTSPQAGKTTIQCKFTSKRAARLGLSEIKDELEKAGRLAARGLADDYVLLTNYFTSGEASATIATAFEGVGVKRCLVLGADWITRQIQSSARLRVMVPRVYGLGDLSQILDERAYDQSRAILSMLGDDLACFVVTDAHRKSVRALLDHQFVLLLGDPASGKSTIAASLALGALDHWGCPTIRISSPEEVARHWNPHEQKQFFWIDDAFGATQYQRHSTDAWNRQLPLMNTALRKGARFLLTSRTYIWRAAYHDLKTSAFPLFDRSQVVIDVQGLRKEEKAQILYNHIKLGDQSQEFRRDVKPFLADLAADNHFLPETARRLGSSFFTSNLVVSGFGILDFARRPVAFLKEVLRNLDEGTAAAVALVFMHGGSVPSPVDADHRTKVIADLLGVSTSQIRGALEALQGSLMLLVQGPEGLHWTFKHPTIGDAYAALVADSPELTEIYLRGAKREKLLREVVCSGVTIEGASVHVPHKLYPLLIERVTEKPLDFYTRYFLAERCDRYFLEAFIDRQPTLLDQRVLPFMAYSSETRIMAKLHELGLLPEDKRLAFVEHVEELTVETPDGAVLRDDNLRSLFTDQEFAALKDRIEEETIPALESLISEWESNCGSDDDPDSYFEEFDRFLESVEMEYDEQATIVMQARNAREKIKRAVESLNESREPTKVERIETPSNQEIEGGGDLETIFEDLDQGIFERS